MFLSKSLKNANNIANSIISRLITTSTASTGNTGNTGNKHSPKEEKFAVRTNWTKEEIREIYNQPLLQLVYDAATAHRQHFNAQEVQQCTLLSIKTGGCPENCSYCPQSSTHKGTPVKAQRLMKVDDVVAIAKEAKDAGSTRFCMGAAWREVTGQWQFEQVLSMVKQVRNMEMEVCCTLGMLKPEHANALKVAGLTAYNHNLDTSREYYPSIITSRTYDERLETLKNVREAGISVCCGGIIGLGEGETDRIGLIHTLATLPEHPESVPVNALVPVEGTPLSKQEKIPVWELVRMIATARVTMPKSIVRLSAGRVSLSQVEQALCFFAGANSIFTGDRLLTTPNNDKNEDSELFEILGLKGKAPDFAQGPISSFKKTNPVSEHQHQHQHQHEHEHQHQHEHEHEHQPKRAFASGGGSGGCGSGGCGSCH